MEILAHRCGFVCSGSHIPCPCDSYISVCGRSYIKMVVIGDCRFELVTTKQLSPSVVGHIVHWHEMRLLSVHPEPQCPDFIQISLLTFLCCVFIRVKKTLSLTRKCIHIECRHLLLRSNYTEGWLSWLRPFLAFVTTSKNLGFFRFGFLAGPWFSPGNHNQNMAASHAAGTFQG
jgi:hypothetical protein